MPTEDALHILYVTSYYKPAYVYGGPVRSISALCEAISRLGVRLSVLTTNANGRGRLDVPTERPVDVNGVQVIYFPVSLNGFFFYSPKLAAALPGWVSRVNLIVIEAFNTFPLGPAVAACKRAGKPYVIPMRGQFFPWALKQKQWKKLPYLALVGWRYLNGAAGLSCSDWAEAEAVSRLNLCAPTFVVPNGIETARFERLPEYGTFRRRYGILKRARVLLFMGRLNHIKRPDIAIEALAAAQSMGEVHLVMAGPDEEQLKPALLSLAQRLGCAGHVHFVGMLEGDDVLGAFAEADLMLMPSEVQESFGMSAVEAMGTGLPVLLSEGVPVGRWAEEAGAGRQVPCTMKAFARATCELLSNPEQLQAMGKRGRELVRRKFDIQVVAHQMLAQYESIVKTGRPLLETMQCRDVSQRLV